MKSLVRIKRSVYLAIALACGSSGPCDVVAAPGNDVAGDPHKQEADKLRFTLFDPTPVSLMREFNTDRPDVTESPYTVDAGHFQVEFSFAEYTHDDGQGTRTDGWAVVPANFRVGLLNNLDLQLLVNPFQELRSHGHGISQHRSGLGYTELRSNLNLWGNDGGKTAFSLMPFVRFPTGSDGLSNHHIEGGLILPLAVQELPAGFDLGAMAEFDVDRNNQNGAYGVDFIHSVALEHSLFVEELKAYGEYVGISPMGTGHTYLAYFDTGATYALTRNTQLDIGINIGLAGRADDFTVFAGFSFRL
jgi:hypothetical protein